MSATSGKPGKSRFSAHPPSRRDRGRIKAAQPWREAPDNDGPLVLYGIHAVAAALANPARRISRLMATENAENRLGEAVAQRGLSVERVRPKDLDRLLGADTVHQGVAAEAEPLPEPELAQLVAASASGHGPLVVLDQVTDPHNVGAVLRSAAVFGAAGLVTTRRHSPPLNGTLAKAASGALEMVPVAMVQNLARTLDELKNAGVTVIGQTCPAIVNLTANTPASVPNVAGDANGTYGKHDVLRSIVFQPITTNLVATAAHGLVADSWIAKLSLPVLPRVWDWNGNQAAFLKTVDTDPDPSRPHLEITVDSPCFDETLALTASTYFDGSGWAAYQTDARPVRYYA